MRWQSAVALSLISVRHLGTTPAADQETCSLLNLHPVSPIFRVTVMPTWKLLSDVPVSSEMYL